MKKYLTLAAGGLLAACTPAVPPGEPLVKQVVLVHGFGESGIKFKCMKRRLEKRGMECYVARLRSRDGQGGLEYLARGLKSDIDDYFGPESGIAVIGFSMGGIVSRYYLQELGGAARCKSFITISSPHQGTCMAYLYPSQGAREMRPGSDFLKRLAATESRLGRMPVASYRTPLDLVIVPSGNSIWPRADNIEYTVALHPLMVSSPSVIADIERRLTKTAASH